MINDLHKTSHQVRIERFMRLAHQNVPDYPTMPSLEVRRLRATLIMEEALETIRALGFSAVGIKLHETYPQSIELLADGCGDLSVVTIGTLSAYGIRDEPILHMIDDNNLDKITYGTIRSDGKLIKPPGHKPPDIKTELERQRSLFSSPTGTSAIGDVIA